MFYIHTNTLAYYKSGVSPKNFIDKGFLKLLEKLKHDLDKGKNAGSRESSQGHSGRNGESQVEKFLKRYGNRQASSMNR